MPNSDAAYIKGLISVLKKRDVDELREFLKEEASIRDPSKVNEIESIDECSLETRMYKMILARKELADLHADARRWLNEHGEEVRF